MSMRRPFVDGLGTTITETFTLDQATIANYESNGNMFVIYHDTAGTQSTPTTNNIKITDTTITNVKVDNADGSILYSEVPESMYEFRDVTITTLDGKNYGGAFYVKNALQYTISNLDATDFVAAQKGSLLYHQNTGAQNWDLTVNIQNGDYNCDSVTTFDWNTIVGEVDSRT